MPQVAILGSGAVGALLGALLHRAGTDIVLVTTEAGVEAINTSGITVSSPRYGDFTERVPAVAELDEPADALIVAVKAPQLSAALRRIGERPTVTIPLLNGVEHLQPLRVRFGSAQTIAATVRVQAHRTDRTHVVHRAPFLTVTLADPGAPALEQMLRAADVDVDRNPAEEDVLWHKLARLAGLALATSAADAPLGQVRADAEAVAREVVKVANAEGAHLSAETIVEELRALPDDASSSLRADLAAGSPDHELDAIGGAVLRAAARHNIDTPVTARLTAR